MALRKMTEPDALRTVRAGRSREQVKDVVSKDVEAESLWMDNCSLSREMKPKGG